MQEVLDNLFQATLRRLSAQIKASGYPRKYLAKHESDILLHRVAKKTFHGLGLEKLHSVKNSEKKNRSGVDRFCSQTSKGCAADSVTELFWGIGACRLLAFPILSKNSAVSLSYKMKLDAMNRQGQRNDLTSRQVVGKLESADVIGRDTGESGRQVQRYIRLTNLNPELIDRVDNKTLAFNSAVEVSYLADTEQTMLIEAIARQEATPNLNQAQRLKKYSQEGKLDENVMDAIMTEEKLLDNKLVLKEELLSPFFPKDYTPLQKQQTILKLLADWHKRQMRQLEPER